MLGLGEEASLLARVFLERGAEVVAHDPTRPKLPVVKLVDSLQDAVSQADVVISLNSSLASLDYATKAATALQPGALYCDLNASTPDLKKRLSALFPQGSFVDVAVMGSISELAHKVPLSVSGSGAAKLVELFEPLGLDLTLVSDQAGDAAARGQLRSLIDNGISAVLVDVLWAAKELGLESWALKEIQNQLEAMDATPVQTRLNQTAKNAKKRSVALGDTVELLAAVGYESTMLNGIAATLSKAMHNVKIPFANPND